MVSLIPPPHPQQPHVMHTRPKHVVANFVHAPATPKPTHVVPTITLAPTLEALQAYRVHWDF